MPQIIPRETRCPVPFSRRGTRYLTVLSKIRREVGVALCSARPTNLEEVRVFGPCVVAGHLREVTAPSGRVPLEIGNGGRCGGTVLVRVRSGREVPVFRAPLGRIEAT